MVHSVIAIVQIIRFLKTQDPGHLFIVFLIVENPLSITCACTCCIVIGSPDQISGISFINELCYGTRPINRNIIIMGLDNCQYLSLVRFSF